MFTRKRKGPLLLVHNFLGQQISKRFNKQSLRTSIAPLDRLRQTQNIFHQRSIQKWHTHFERIAHAHRVGIPQERVHHVRTQFQPRYLRELIHRTRLSDSFVEPLIPEHRSPLSGAAFEPRRKSRRRKKQSREKIRVRKQLRLKPSGQPFAKSVRRSFKKRTPLYSRRCHLTQWFRKKAGRHSDTSDFGSRLKRSIAAKEFIAPEAGKRNFQPSLSRRPGNKVGVDAVHRRLIQRGHRLRKPAKHFFAGNHGLAMLSSKAFCRPLRNRSFAEFCVGKRNRESMNSTLRLGRKRRDCRGIDSAAQKHADRYVRDYMTPYSILQQRANLHGGRCSGDDVL